MVENLIIQKVVIEWKEFLFGTSRKYPQNLYVSSLAQWVLLCSLPGVPSTAWAISMSFCSNWALAVKWCDIKKEHADKEQPMSPEKYERKGIWMDMSFEESLLAIMASKIYASFNSGKEMFG